MTTQNKIIIALLILIIVITIVWFVQDYQKTERQYQACLEKCQQLLLLAFSPGEPITTNPIYDICIAECKENYAK